MTADNKSSDNSKIVLTPNMEDYMETISLLAQVSRVVRVKDIAKKLNIKMPSVTAALNKLKEKKLINYEKYGFIELTESGKEIADNIFKKHTCLSGFLHKILQLEKHDADEEACKLEHYLSTRACTQIEKFMNFYNESVEKKEDWTEKLNKVLN